MGGKVKHFLFHETNEKVANNRLISYCIGLIGQNMNYNFVCNRLFVFLNTVLGIDPKKTGIITGLSTIFDAVNDPVIGALIDARKYRKGRKLRPFLLYVPPIIGLFTAVLFMDMGLAETETIVFVLAIYFVIDVFYSIHDVALWGMISLSSPSSDERARVTQWISIAAGAGATVASTFPAVKQWLVGSGLANESTAYFIGAVVFGFGGMILAMPAYRMIEKVECAPPEKRNILKSIKHLWNNKTLMIILVARTVGFLSPTLPWEYFFESNGIAYDFMGKQISGGTAQMLYGFICGIPSAFAVFFAVKIIKKVGGMKRILVISEIIQVSLRLFAFFIGANDRFLNPYVLFTVMFLVSLINIPVSMKDIAHRNLIATSIDEIELETGERTEGISFSMQNFVTKLTAALSKIIQGYLLSFLGFDTNIKRPAGANPVPYQTGRFIKYRWHQFMLGPAVGSALYLIAILFLHNDPEKTTRIEQELKEKREKEALKEQEELLHSATDH